jgi:hypothetical protein
MVLHILRFAARFYAGLYLVLSVLTVPFVGISLVIALAEHDNQATLLSGTIFPGINLILGAVLFVIWSRIFLEIYRWLSGKVPSEKKNSFIARLHSLLVAASFSELTAYIFNRAVGRHGIDWSKVPSIYPHSSFPEKILYAYLWLLRQSALSEFWITPRTTGLATLFIAGLLHLRLSVKAGNKV